jgi:hypothetical protein
MNLIDALSLGVPTALQAWLAFLLARKTVRNRFVWFFTYTTFSLIAGVVKVLVHGNKWQYSYVYWSAEALYAVLGFLAIYEAFRSVFRSFYVLWWFKYLLPAAGFVMLAIAIIKGVLFPPVQAPPVLATILISELAVRCLQGGIFALFVALVWFNSMPAWNRAFGIALGFSVSSLGILLTILIRSEFGIKVAPLITLGPAVAYIMAEAIWLIVFLKPEPPDPFAGIESSLTPAQVIGVLEEYTQQIKDWFRRCFPTPSS